MNKKLYRDEYHKVLGGVCSGLAEYFDIDVTVLRLLFAFTLLTMGVGLIPYIVLWIVLPKKGYLYNNFNNPNVDYTVPPQQPGEQFTHQGNPFQSSSFNNSKFGGSPFQSNSFGSNPIEGLPQKKSNAGIIIGLILIVIGAAVLIDEFDLIPDFDFERLWPVVLVLAGAAIIVSGQKQNILHRQNWDNTSKEENTVSEEPASTDNNPAV